MHRTTRTLCALMVIAVSFAACKKDEDAGPPDLGFGYFPTQVGTWVEYRVDSAWRDDALSVRDTITYQLRERITEHFTDAEGRPCQRITRYVQDEEGEWVVRDIWSSTKSNTAVEKTEENIRRLKLSFPTREGRAWDMNVYNTVDDLEVAFRDVDEPWSTGGLSFDSTLIVRNTVGPNPIIKRNFEERYAKNVGMVQKYWEETESQYSNTSPPVLQVKGFRLDMVVTAHGQD
jgi:hypothetical protein